MTIYELTGELLSLYEMAEDPEIDAECLADTIEAVSGEFEIKADGYVKVIKQMEADAEALKKEADRLTERKRTIEKNIERIKSTLQNAMNKTGKTKFKTELFSFSIRKNPAKVILADGIDIDNVDAEFIKFADPEIDKSAVKEALKNGVELSWARLEQGESLSIK